MTTLRALAFALAAVVGFAAPAAAQPLALPPNAHAVIEKMLARNPSLASYTSRVHVNLRMLNFPFLAPTLDGTTYFKRPDNFVVVFDRVPSYAKGFSKLFNDVGDPASWEKDQNVTLQGTQVMDGRTMLVLRMTKKIHSTILDHVLAYVDPATYELDRMEWYYTSGGKITMRQWYRSQGAFSVLSQQHVEIDIPHVHAVGDSTYATYQTNVAVDDGVFVKK
ncbi:MAG: hypothetical protein KGN02_09895 [bacterium]|nr:hypothetical protein [bacterium]